MIFGLSTQVLKDTLLPVPLHMIPVFNHTMSDRVVHAISLRVSHRLIANMKIEVFDSPFGGEVRSPTDS